MVLTAAPIIEVSMLVVWAALFNLKQMYEQGYIPMLAGGVSVGIAVGMILFIIYAQCTERAVRRNSKYTYFDICGKAVVYSRYRGEYSHLGEKIIQRELYVMQLKDFKQAYVDEKKKHLILIGKMRVYLDNTDNLGYHVENGNVDFDNWWYNEAGFKTVNMLKLPMDFERPTLIARKMYEAKRDFDAIPEKKPYVFVEADIVKKRKELKKLKEEMRYVRQW